jgi:CO/xanthine dehydrogenase Mo-binding subunit
VIEIEVKIGRHSGVPLETRGLVADYDPERPPHDLGCYQGAALQPAGALADAGMPLNRISMKKSDAGGGFGIRGEFYPEDFWYRTSPARPGVR